MMEHWIDKEFSFWNYLKTDAWAKYLIAIQSIGIVGLFYLVLG